eukprot:CFRG3354T1
MVFVFVYGTLTNVAVLERVVGHAVPKRATGLLKKHARYAIDGEIYPGVIRMISEHVKGNVIEVSETDMEILDDFEGPEYERRVVDVVIESDADSGACVHTSVEADVYIYIGDTSRLKGEWSPDKFAQFTDEVAPLISFLTSLSAMFHHVLNGFQTVGILSYIAA